MVSQRRGLIVNLSHWAAQKRIGNVAYGVSKSVAVRAAISAGMVHGLITHASLARELLKLAQS